MSNGKSFHHFYFLLSEKFFRESQESRKVAPSVSGTGIMTQMGNLCSISLGSVYFMFNELRHWMNIKIGSRLTQEKKLFFFRWEEKRENLDGEKD